MSGADLYVVGLTVVGIVLVFWKNKRRFDRLNQLGIERYPSFGQKIGAKFVDGVLYSFGFVFLVTAAIAFFIEHAQSIPVLSASFALFIIYLIFNFRRNSRR